MFLSVGVPSLWRGGPGILCAAAQLRYASFSTAAKKSAMSLIKELKRRNVFRVGIAYLLVGWVVMQVGEVMASALQLPSWVLSTLAFFLILGFPLALIFAWAFELTPEGIKFERNVESSQSVTTATGRKLEFVIFGVLVIAVGFLLYGRADKPHQDTDRATSERAGNELSDSGPHSPPVPAGGRKAIAVLPFQNLSADEENAYFAAGVHEDILTYLSRIAELRVNSRTSVQQYAGTEFNLKEVAAALGAAYVVEGSVRRAGNHVRVTAQLIDATTDEHIWAENYDRELTDIFAIQTAVAQEIVSALQAKLSPQEKALISGRPTNSIEAYDLFLRARGQMQGISAAGLNASDAAELLEAAVALDPNYAQAWALLALAHGDVYWFLEDRTPARLEKMKLAVDRAFELNPGLPEAVLAKAAYYYRGFYDYPKSLELLEQAKQLIPNDPFVHFGLGLTLRRLGEYKRSVDSFLNAAELDPAYSEAWAEAINTAVASGQVQRALDIAAMVPPQFQDIPRLKAELAALYLNHFGNVTKAKELLASVPPSKNHYYLEMQYQVALVEHDYEAAAQRVLAPELLGAVGIGWGYALAAQWLHKAGLTERAGEMTWEALRLTAQEVSKPYAETYAWPHLAYAEALAAAGRFEEAVASCARTIEVLSVEMDKVHGAGFHLACAKIKGLAGQTDAALDDIEQALELGWGVSPWLLKLDPSWDFLRGNPRFDAMATP